MSALLIFSIISVVIAFVFRAQTTRNEFLLMCAIFIFGFVVISTAAINRHEIPVKKVTQPHK